MSSIAVQNSVFLTFFSSPWTYQSAGDVSCIALADGPWILENLVSADLDTLLPSGGDIMGLTQCRGASNLAPSTCGALCLPKFSGGGNALQSLNVLAGSDSKKQVQS